MRLFLAGIRKLVRRPATWVTFLLLVGLLLLIFVAVGASARQAASQEGGQAALLLVTFPGAYTFVVGFILGLGGLLAVIYGAAIAGSEWSWGTLKNAVARGESRSRYALLTFASLALMLALGLILAFLIGIVGAIIGAVLAAVSTSGLGDTATLRTLPEQLARGWLAILEEAALGFTIATLARSQLAGIGVGIGLYFGEQFAGIFLPDIVKYLPFDAANAVINTSGLGSNGGAAAARSLSPDVALVVVVAWLIGSLAVTALFTEGAEISG